MFDLASGWGPKLAGAVLPSASSRPGWSIENAQLAGFVEPAIRVIHGDPATSKAIVIAAPGAVGKSVFARTLCAQTNSVLVDLARTELLGGNFFVGGIANAFGLDWLAKAAQGQLGLVIDALDEAQLRSGAEGFAAGLTDLANIVKQNAALPVSLFGRSAAADEAWLVLSEAGINPCLMEIEFFDEERAQRYLTQKLEVLADRTEQSRTAYSRHADSFLKLAVATREKLLRTQGGDDPRFAGYAPVLDAVCSYAVEDESLNPQARISQLSAEGPVALIAEIAGAILKREQGKLVDQLREEVGLDGVDATTLYAPEEQLARLAAAVLGTPMPAGPVLSRSELKRAYDRMVGVFAPQHPFLDARSQPSNAVFSAYLVVWALTSGGYSDAVRRRLVSRPSLSSGLLFELYMLRFDDQADPLMRGVNDPRVAISDVGALYSALTSQATQNQHASLEVTGEPDEEVVEVVFEIEGNTSGEQGRHYGPYEVALDGVLEFRGPLGNVTITAPLSLIAGDGAAVSITAPVEIEVDTLDLDGRELRIFKSAGKTNEEFQQVTLFARDASVNRVEKITVLGGRLSVSFPGSQQHPWNEYSVTPLNAPSEEVEVLRRRLRRVLTAFRSHSKGALVRLAAKIEHARMMKRDAVGPRLVEKLKDDGILTTFDAGKFFQLHPDKMAAALNMDYVALQQQRWSPEADAYLEALV